MYTGICLTGQVVRAWVQLVVSSSTGPGRYQYSEFTCAVSLYVYLYGYVHSTNLYISNLSVISRRL